MKWLKGLGIASLLGLTVAPSAIAIPFGSNSVYRTEENGKVYVYASTGTPAQEISMSFSGIPKSVTRTADACGQISFKISATEGLPPSFNLGSRTVNVTSLGQFPQQLKPSCNSTTGELAEARPNDYRVSDDTIIFVGFAPRSGVVVNYEANRIRKVKTNACGFARFAGTTSIPLTTSTRFSFITSVGGVDDVDPVSSLPLAAVPPRCLKVNGVSQGFRPMAWN
ncbi:MAG: hypothetical protein LRZ84_22815 [Desertifilum sp.]|nr:hypothetical protein [Desertifilum sp.]